MVTIGYDEPGDSTVLVTESQQIEECQDRGERNMDFDTEHELKQVQDCSRYNYKDEQSKGVEAKFHGDFECVKSPGECFPDAAYPSRDR